MSPIDVVVALKLAAIVAALVWIARSQRRPSRGQPPRTDA